jgi:regulator of replication initiation timing
MVCCRCGKTATLSETDSKEKQLIEMKKRLEKLITEKTVLRMEIQQLEDEILDEKIIGQD